MQTWISERRLPPILLALLLALIAAATWQALARPLWVDEAMALNNYPLEGIAALFQPLPRYDQAAPPLFNALSSLIIDLPLPGQRLLLFATIGGLTLFAMRTVPGRWSLVAALVVVVAGRHWIQLATEFKYYGLEMASAALFVAWTVNTARRHEIRARDVAQLALVTLLGVGGLVISVVAVGVVLLQRSLSDDRFALRRLAPSWREACLLTPLAAFVVGYFLLIRYGSSVQLATYSQVYDIAGLKAVFGYLEALAKFIGFGLLPFVLASAAICMLDLRGATTRSLMLLSVATVVLFGALVFVGAYPASAVRHVAWVGGFLVMLAGNAALIVERRWRAGAPDRFALTAALAATAVIALLPAAWRLTKPDLFTVTANDRLVAWLERSPPVDVGLWVGGQPVVEAYERARPTLRKHRYFGLVNAASPTLGADFPSREGVSDPRELARRVEAGRQAPGAWGRLTAYTVANDCTAPAAALIAEAPRGRPFYILASHIDLKAPDPKGVGRAKAPFTALRAARCAYATELQVKAAYVIRAICPN